MHHIHQGDAFKILPTLEKESIDLCFTSPPYNVGKEYDLNLPEDEYIQWCKDWMKLIPPLLKDTGVFVLNIGDKVTKVERSTRIPELWLYAVKELGLHYIELYIWNKGKMLPIRSNYRATNVYEPCIWFSKSKRFRFYREEVRRPYNPISIKRMEYKIKKRWARDPNNPVKEYKEWAPNPAGALPKNILDIGSEFGNKVHPAVFPRRLAEWFIKASTLPGQMVLDPFLGAGTSMVASAGLGRSSTGIELEPRYVDLSYDRLKEAGYEAEIYYAH